MGAGPIQISILADGDRAIREMGKVSRNGRSLGSTFAKAGKVAAIGLGVVAVAAVGAAGKLAAAAAEDQASASKMAQTFEKAAGATKGQIAATESWITAQGKAKGVADDQLRPALSSLVTATGDVREAQKLASLAMDVSAAKGKSLESVSTALMKAQNGNVSALARLGINTKNAAGETIGMEEATKRMGALFGGAAKTQANTLQGRMDRLKLMLSEAGEAIGYRLLPPLLSFGEWVSTKGVPAVQRFGAEMSARFGPVLARIGNAIKTQVVPALMQIGSVILSQGVPALKAIGGAIGSVVGFFIQWQAVIVPIAAGIAAMAAAFKIYQTALATVRAITAAYTAVQAALNVVMTANPIGLIVLAVIGLAAAFVVAYKRSATFRGIVQGALNAVKDVASSVAGFFTKKIPAAFNTVVSAAGSVLGWVKGNWPKILAVLTGPIGVAVLLIVKNWDKIKAGFSAAVEGVKSGGGRLLDYVKSIPGKILAGLGNVGTLLKNAGVQIIQGLLDGIQSMIGKVTGKLSELTDKIPDWKGPASRDRKLLRRNGQLIIEGLLTGFADRTPDVSGTLKKLTKSIGGYFDLKFKKDKVANAATKRALKGLRDEYAAVSRNAAARERVNAALKTARDNLKAAKQASDDFAASMKQAVVDMGNITQLGQNEDGSASAGGIIAQLKDRLVKAQRFTALIRTLTANSLNKTSLQQLLSAGVEGGLAAAEAIAAGGAGAISEINDLTSQLAAQGATLGRETAQTFHGAGVQAAQGIVAGLESQAAKLDRAAIKLANALVRAVKKALGIKSPSTKFKGIAKNVVAGLDFSPYMTHVQRQGDRLAKSLEYGFGTPALDAYMASPAVAGGSSQRLELVLSAEAVDQLTAGKKILAAADLAISQGARTKHLMVSRPNG